MESLHERLRSLSRAELLALVAVIVVTLGGAALWYARSLPQPVNVEARGLGGHEARTEPAATETPGPMLIVHVAGSVRHPGVYEFHEGERVIDAIQAAGGFRRGADESVLNLAAALTDGLQILVPRAAPSAGEVPGTVPGQPAGAAGGLININAATATDLEALPGIGEVIAQAIVDYRTENGPFASVDALEEVSGIGPATMEEIRDLVTV